APGGGMLRKGMLRGALCSLCWIALSSLTSSTSVAAESRLADANPVYAKMRKNFASLVKGGTVAPHWLDGNDFWYSTELSGQRRYLKVDPETGTVTELFDVPR